MSSHPTGNDSGLFRICFVCTGNICRSPMAEVVFRDLAADAGLAESLTVTSAGTGDWHVGGPADERTVTALGAQGYDGSRHRAQQFDPEWFENLDLVVALDRSHEATLKSWAATAADRDKVQLLLSYDPKQSDLHDVPDPYHSDADMFDAVLGMIERASTALVDHLEPTLRRRAS